MESALKTFCDEHEKWHAAKMNHLFKTKAEFAKEWGKGRVAYNSHSAYAKAHSLNATSVQESWAKVKSYGDTDLWKAEASRLTTDGCNVYTLQRYIP